MELTHSAEIGVLQNRQQNRVVAPRDDEPRWPQGYVAVLREAGAQEKTIPYCLAWVRSFFARYPGRKRRELGRTEIEAFLSELGRRPQMSNWRVAQTRGAPGEPSPPASVESPRVSLRAASPTSDDERGYGDDRSRGKVFVRSETTIRASGKPLGAEARAPAGARLNWVALRAKVQECLRVAHYAYRTEQTYIGWIRNFVAYHGWRKPSTLGAEEIKAFLKHLAEERQVSASTQNQALNSIVLLYQTVLKKEAGDFSDFQRARRGFRLPVVASRAEIKAVLERLEGRELFMSALLYGTGMRINELLRLRVQDVDFEQSRLIVRGGKGVLDAIWGPVYTLYI